jgi:SagB-type dehydrogenase family enzyme
MRAGCAGKNFHTAVLAAAVTFLSLLSCGGIVCADTQAGAPREIALPGPVKAGPLSVEEAIQKRRSIRELGGGQIELSDVAQLLWAAQGVTDESRGRRAAPSAGAKYPIELYVVAGDVEGLVPGLYHYVPGPHALSVAKEGDVREELCKEALSQEWVRDAELVIVIAAVYERTMEKYGERGVRYAHIEVGAVAENIYLQAESLGLGTTFVGAFSDDGVKKVLGLSDAAPLGIMPVGTRR